VERVAVIDMGSNSFRLVVYGYVRGRFWQHADEIREPVRVGEGIDQSGELGSEPMDRALRTASVFASFCASSNIDDVIAVATSAIRDASNRDELLDRIRAETGLEVRVIGEREEARYGYLAVANSTTLADGFGFDIGGGSVQVTRLAGRQLADAASRPLGAVRMSERFLPGEKAGGKALKAVRKHVRKSVAGADWFAPGEGLRAVGIGGTIRNLATAAERRAEMPYTDAQGFCLTRDALEDLVEHLASLPASKRGAVPGIKPDRGDVILAGAVVLAELMERGGVDAVEASDAGLREGIFFERYLDGADPPLFEDVPRASVENLANRYHDDLAHPRHVAALSLQMFDALAEAGLHAGEPESRELLWAACLLHDIGTTVDYDDHHKHSHYLILNAGLPGFSPREVGLVALVARYHRKGEPDVSELGPLARKRDGERVALLSGIIRLAEQLERSRDRSVGAVRLDAANGRVRLVPEAGADPGAGVAIWSARRSADLLASVLDRPVEIADPG
jgi:exopolyphosphatase/guanosine-5'-triphosphate,3'-diphosphate pyrophosphatase